MIYLPDANVLIDANRDYYSFGRVPEFWEWLIHQGTIGNIKIPEEIFYEIIEGDDELSDWISRPDVRLSLLLPEEIKPNLIQRITYEGYAENLNDEEIEAIGNDPFLMAYALYDIDNRCVVTTEVSRPSKQRANKHVPDVCSHFQIHCCNPFELYRILDFRTDWDS